MWRQQGEVNPKPRNVGQQHLTRAAGKFVGGMCVLDIKLQKRGGVDS